MNTVASADGLSVIADIILGKLNRDQRTFILKMKPHQRSQRMSMTDWRDVDCCVDSGTDWPDLYWFGGMRLQWIGGRSSPTFMFNEHGLEARAVLASGMQLREDALAAEAEGLQPGPKGTPNPSSTQEPTP